MTISTAALCSRNRTRCRIPIWRTFGRIQWHVIPKPRITLQGEFIVMIPEPHATLQGVRIPSAILKIVFAIFYYEAQPCRYCFYSVVQNGFFAPQGGHVRCPDKCEIWHKEADLLPRAKFHVYRGRNVGIQPPKLSKFRILAINLALRGVSFSLFLRHSQHLYASTGSF